MNSLLLKKMFPFFFVLVALQAKSQYYGGYDGDALFYYLGKAANSIEIKDLKAHYNCVMVNETRYLSNGGVELILKKGALSEINIYNKSAVYGVFADKLPKKLKFGMSSSEVKQLLGKALVSYNSGYSEFENNGVVITCWFEGSRLSQVGLALKS
jgi:hypothetical protein